MKLKSESEVSQWCLTLSDPMDCSPPGSSVHGVFQARVLEWGAIAFSEPSVRALQTGYVLRVGSRGGVKNSSCFHLSWPKKRGVLALNGMVSLTQKLSSTKIWTTRKFAIQKSVT